MKELKLDTGKVLYELERQELSKVQLAQKMGTTKQNLNYILQSRPVSQVSRVADALGVDPLLLVAVETT